jgi:hypothetical protein
MKVTANRNMDALLHQAVSAKDESPGHRRGYVVDTYPDSDFVLVEWLDDDGATIAVEDWPSAELAPRD